MLNHARTLLLNRAAQYYGAASAHYIPTEFNAVTLTPALQRVRDILLPQGLAPSIESSLADSVMPMLYCPDMMPYVQVFDPRLTYSTGTAEFSELSRMSVSVESYRGGSDLTPQYAVTSNTSPVSLATAGNHTWTLRNFSASQAYLDSGADTRLVALAPASNHESNRIEAILGRFYIYLLMPSGALNGEYRFTYAVMLPPTYNVGEKLRALDHLLADVGIAHALYQQYAPYADYIRILSFMQQQCSEGPLRFASIVTAYLYQVERLRREQGQG